MWEWTKETKREQRQNMLSHGEINRQKRKKRKKEKDHKINLNK